MTSLASRRADAFPSGAVGAIDARGTSISPDTFEVAFAADHRRRLRRAALWRFALNALGIAAFLLAWELIPRYSGWVNAVLFPPPSEVVQAFIPLLLSGEVLRNIEISLARSADRPPWEWSALKYGF